MLVSLKRTSAVRPDDLRHLRSREYVMFNERGNKRRVEVWHESVGSAGAGGVIDFRFITATSGKHQSSHHGSLDHGHEWRASELWRWREGGTFTASFVPQQVLVSPLYLRQDRGQEWHLWTNFHGSYCNDLLMENLPKLLPWFEPGNIWIQMSVTLANTPRSPNPPPSPEDPWGQLICITKDHQSLVLLTSWLTCYG